MKRFTFKIFIVLVIFVSGVAAAFVWDFYPQLAAVKENGSVLAALQATPKNAVAQTKNLAAIEIARYDSESEIKETKLEHLTAREITRELGLGENIENQVIALHPFPNDLREFKVEQQFETSMTIMDEGPHYDLTDWKHYISDWQEIQKLAENRFLTSKIDEADSIKFPKVTSKEIYRAVSKNGDEKWVEHARLCKSPNDYPCGVSVSKISFRIMAKENGVWGVIHRINFIIPMGC